MGKMGQDLRYRGFDINDLAEYSTFEEVAHLLVHDELPIKSELERYKRRIEEPAWYSSAGKSRSGANSCGSASDGCGAHRSSMLGAVLPERGDHSVEGARQIADRLLAVFPSMLIYWYQYAHHGKRIEVETDDDSIAGHFLHLLHGQKPTEIHERAMDVISILYAEHEFNASTFSGRVIAGTGTDFYSAITGAIGALKGYKHGGANEGAMEFIERFKNILVRLLWMCTTCCRIRGLFLVLDTLFIPFPIRAPKF